MSDTPPDNDPLPSLSELRAIVGGQTATRALERRYLKRFAVRSLSSEESYARLKGLQDHYRHKGHWSWFLMLLMAGMIGFQSYLLVRVGQGAWSFADYNWLLPALLAQNLAQVVGLAVFVVKALFSDPGIKIDAASSPPTPDSDD